MRDSGGRGGYVERHICVHEIYIERRRGKGRKRKTER